MENINLTLGIFLFAAVFFSAFGIFLAWVVSPKKPFPSKLDPYECGVEPIGEAWQPVTLNYYLYALVFVLFDIECIFLFPIAVVFKSVGIWAFAETLLFVIILALALFYAIKKKALKWY